MRGISFGGRVDRRTLLAAGGVAGGALAIRGTALAQEASPPPAPSALRGAAVWGEGVLQREFTPARLDAALVPLDRWHPYPRIDDRAGWDAVPADLRAVLVDRGVAALTAPSPPLRATSFLDFKRAGLRSPYEAVLFARRHLLADLVLAECAEARGRFVAAIADRAWEMCEETFWGSPAHMTMQRDQSGLADIDDPILDLFSVESAVTLAWTRYLMQPQLAAEYPLVARRIATETRRRILDPFLTRDDYRWMGFGARTSPLNNWTPWIASNILTVALLQESDPARRTRAVARTVRMLDNFRDSYPADGGCDEGPGYWAHAAGSYFDGVAMLDAATGGGSRALRDPFLRKMAGFVADAHIAGDYYVNFGDASGRRSVDGCLLHRFGRAVGDERTARFGAFQHVGANGRATGAQVAQALRREWMSRRLSGIFDAAALIATPPRDALPRDVSYPALGLMAARVREGSADGFYMALQAASNGRSHGHNDSGSFILFHDGAPVAIDLGSEGYTGKTFGPDRYDIWVMQSAFHNLPTIGGVMEKEGDAHSATALTGRFDRGRATIGCDLAGAYPAEVGLRTWRRTLTLDRAKGAVRLDEAFVLDGAKPVTLSLMTPQTPDASVPGVVVLAAKGTRPVRLRYDPALLSVTVEERAIEDDGLQSSWGPRVFRLLLAAHAPVAAGRWHFDFEA